MVPGGMTPYSALAGAWREDDDKLALAEEDLAVGQGAREEVRRDLSAAVVAGAAEEGGGDGPDADPA